MIDFIKWLTDNDVKFEPFFGGYAWLNVTMQQLRNHKGEIISRREQAISKFSFAIPSEQALEVIKQFGPILEVGSGSGYWAYELKKMGVDIIATDPKPYSDNAYETEKSWTDIQVMNAERALEQYGSGRTLFFCWPSYAADWPTDALKQYSGKTVIYIGEWQGCTADEEFHEILDQQFKETLVIGIPYWSGIHDKMYICERK